MFPALKELHRSLCLQNRQMDPILTQFNPIHILTPSSFKIQFSIGLSFIPRPILFNIIFDRLCGLVVRVPGYRSRGSRFNSLRYQMFWEVVGLERGPLSLVRITEELLEWKVAAPVKKTELTVGDPLRWPRDTLYPQKLALTSPTSGGRSVGLKATEFIYIGNSTGSRVISYYQFPLLSLVFLHSPTCWITSQGYRLAPSPTNITHR
jgi:hypothetical protein